MMSVRKSRDRALETTLLRAIAGALDVATPAPRSPPILFDKWVDDRESRMHHPGKRRGIVLGALIAAMIITFPAWSVSSSDVPPRPTQATAVLTPPAIPDLERTGRTNLTHRAAAPRPPASLDASDLFLDYLRTLIAKR